MCFFCAALSYPQHTHTHTHYYTLLPDLSLNHRMEDLKLGLSLAGFMKCTEQHWREKLFRGSLLLSSDELHAHKHLFMGSENSPTYSRAAVRPDTSMCLDVYKLNNNWVTNNVCVFAFFCFRLFSCCWKEKKTVVYINHCVTSSTKMWLNDQNLMTYAALLYSK